MSDMLWVKMPTTWVTEGVMKDQFSSLKFISADISALKIYMYLCLYSIPVTVRMNGNLDAKFYPITARLSDCITSAESKVTYDDIGNACSLSRKLISDGLKRLYSIGMVQKKGSTRKVIYAIQGSLNSGWAKLPKRELIKLNCQIEAFHSIKNRYSHERDGLKVYIYLLAIRTNKFQNVDVSKLKIMQATGVDVYSIDKAVSYLIGIGLLSEVIYQGYKKGSRHYDEKSKLYRYFVMGSSALNLPSTYKNIKEEIVTLEG